MWLCKHWLPSWAADRPSPGKMNHAKLLSPLLKALKKHTASQNKDFNTSRAFTSEHQPKLSTNWEGARGGREIMTSSRCWGVMSWGPEAAALEGALSHCLLGKISNLPPALSPSGLVNCGSATSDLQGSRGALKVRHFLQG